MTKKGNRKGFTEEMVMAFELGPKSLSGSTGRDGGGGQAEPDPGVGNSWKE